MHVVQRGNNRSACFRDRADYTHYLALLADAAKHEECLVHAYVLMTNHVHLLATGKTDDAVSRMMKRLGERYVQSFNRKHGHTGTLWEGRFRSSVIDSDHYLLACHRYIELNPVRAGIVAAPWEYEWSSFKTNAWGDPSFVRAHPVYLALGRSADRRLLAYRRLFDRPLPGDAIEAIRRAVKGNFALGHVAFIEGLEAMKGRPVTIQPRGRRRSEEARETAAGDGQVSLFDN